MSDVSGILRMMKDGAEIPINVIVTACGASSVSRADLEARIEAAGYVYSIGHDAYMPPEWLNQQRAALRK